MKEDRVYKITLVIDFSTPYSWCHMWMSRTKTIMCLLQTCRWSLLYIGRVLSSWEDSRVRNLYWKSARMEETSTEVARFSFHYKLDITKKWNSMPGKSNFSCFFRSSTSRASSTSPTCNRRLALWPLDTVSNVCICGCACSFCWQG